MTTGQMIKALSAMLPGSAEHWSDRVGVLPGLTVHWSDRVGVCTSPSHKECKKPVEAKKVLK